jgi:peptidoglycan-N-acetylglucosamine deacetylase
MRTFAKAILLCTITCSIAMAPRVSAATPLCTPGSGIGLSRVVEIDTRTGPLFGAHTAFQRAEPFLGPKEVVLTFDDGPMPWITRSILDTLDGNCTKATFFSVGRMAIAYPQTTREIMQRGHTLGTHTWSHPLNLKRLNPDAAIDEIERGFAAVALAAGQPIAPFYRFPGLSDNAAMLTHLQSRGIATFTVDAISNDSYIQDTTELVRRTLAQVETRQGGIILFHDIKAATARALPTILAELNRRGYKVVHMRATATVQPQTQYDSTLAPLLAKAETAGKAKLVPFFQADLRPGKDLTNLPAPEVPVTTIAPEAKVYAARAAESATARKSAQKPLQRAAGATPKPVVSRTRTAEAAAVPSTAQPPAARPIRAASGPVRVIPNRNSGWFTATQPNYWTTTVSPLPRLRRSSAD